MDSRFRAFALAATLLVAAGGLGGTMTQARTTLGHAADPSVIRSEDIDVAPDGTGLPPGSGDAARGALLFSTACAECHGAGLAIDPERWAYATSLFDYIRRAMPPTTRTKLRPDDVYALVAYLLARSSLISERTVMNATSLPAVRMPHVKDFLGPR